MDLNTFEIPDTAKVHIALPGTGPLYENDDLTKPVTITVFGPASSVAVAMKTESYKDVERQLNALGKAKVEGLEKKEIARLVRLTAAVDNVTVNGVVITPANVHLIYGDPKYGWVTEQVQAKVKGWSDFLD